MCVVAWGEKHEEACGMSDQPGGANDQGMLLLFPLLLVGTQTTSPHHRSHTLASVRLCVS